MRLPLLSLAFLAGCSFLDGLDDYVSNVVCEGIYLGVDDPDLAAQLGLDVSDGAATTVFLARATSLSSVEANLLTDADSVSLRSGGSTVELENQGDGTYLALGDGGLGYAAGATYVLEVDHDGRSHTASAVAPDPPDLGDLPDAGAGELHPTGQDLTVDLTGQGYDNWLGLVLDADGTVTWDNRPESAGDYIDWIGGSDDVGVVTIPGSAFPDAGSVYVVGVAGVRRSLDAELSNFNPIVSNWAVGALAAAPVGTAP